MVAWITKEPVNLPAGFFEDIGGNRLISDILIQRGISSSQEAFGFLNPDHYLPSPPENLPGMGKAVDLLKHTISKNEKILVWGDFDVDGQTATTLLISALRQLGADTIHHIPKRDTESHGIHEATFGKIIQNNDVSLLLTCDTGISAHDSIRYAIKNGLKAIITDHHQLPDNLPIANAIVNPKMLPAQHPLASLPGVGVAYKLVEALFSSYKLGDYLDQLLDLVALGITADVVELTKDTRYLLQNGIKQLQKTERVGLLALMNQAEISPENIDEELISFGIAPRLNALGRLADANIIVDFLTTHNTTQAQLTAMELEALNNRRKLLTDQVFEGALAQIERNPEINNDPAIVLSHPSWPGGIIGIVASRLVDYFHKPTILISSPPGDIGRGSARSISGINITDAIAKHSNLLIGFGGHPMAAGFSIESDNILHFKSKLMSTLDGLGRYETERYQLVIDAWLNLKDISLEFIQEINRLAPFGAGNPPLLFASSDLTIIKDRPVGRYNEHRLLTITDPNGYHTEVIWWQGSNYSLPTGKFSLAYTIRASNYRGQPGIQISWVDFQVSEELLSDPGVSSKNKLAIIDFRNFPDPVGKIQPYLNDPETVIWGEGLVGDTKIPGMVNRISLKPSNRLIVWTIPPGLGELKEIIHQVNPQEVILCSINPNADDGEIFLNKLVGLIKYAIRTKNGRINFLDIASATAQRQVVVEYGMTWLAKNGLIELLLEGNDTYRIKLEKKIAKNLTVDRELSSLLIETSAFRNFYARVDINRLFGEYDQE